MNSLPVTGRNMLIKFAKKPGANQEFRGNIFLSIWGQIQPTPTNPLGQSAPLFHSRYYTSLAYWTRIFKSKFSIWLQMCTDNPPYKLLTTPASGSDMLGTCSILCFPGSGESWLGSICGTSRFYKGQKIANKVRLCGGIRLCRLCLRCR